MAIRSLDDEQQFVVAAALRRHGVLRSRQLLGLGLTECNVRTLVRLGSLTRIGRGVYASRRVQATPERMIAAAALRVPRAVVCLFSAAHLHGLVAESPAEVWLAVPASAWRPRVVDLPVRIVVLPDAIAAADVETREIEGVDVPVYSAARTAQDMVEFAELASIDPRDEQLRT